MVHRREVDGREIVLGNQGDLFKRAMTWWDHGTGSVWTQPAGEAILGPLSGTTLELLPSSLTTWGEWRSAHPGTLALDADAGPSGFSIRSMAIVVDIGDAPPVAVRVRDLAEVGVVATEVAGIPAAFVADPEDPDRWAVYSRELDGRLLELSVRDDALVDATTGHRWSLARGQPLGDAGTPLVPLPAFTSFESDYRSHFPDGILLEGAGS